MNNILETVRTWTPQAALVVSVVSVILVIWQIRNLIRSIHTQTYQRVYELMIEIDKFFIDNPTLKPYFYPDTDIKADETVEKEKLLSIAEMMMDYFDNVYHQRGCMPRHTFSGFREFMRNVFTNSQIIREYLAMSGREQWSPEDFIDCIKGASKTNGKVR
jgi:hypothetical protein